MKPGAGVVPLANPGATQSLTSDPISPLQSSNPASGRRLSGPTLGNSRLELVLVRGATYVCWVSKPAERSARGFSGPKLVRLSIRGMHFC